MVRRSVYPVFLLPVLLSSGCQTPGQTGVVAGVTSGAVAAGIAKIAGANDTVTALVGVGTALVVGGISYEVQRQHEATEAQRRAAEAEFQRRLDAMPPEQVAKTPKEWAIRVPVQQGSSSTQPEFIRVNRETKVASEKVDVLDKAPPSGTTAQVEKEASVYFP